MKKPQATKHLEIKAYTHLDVRVIVEIDYDKETISLLEQPQHRAHKQWVFSGRTLAYMQGWLDILDSMKFAIEQATADLEKHVEARKRSEARLMAMVLEK